MSDPPPCPKCAHEWTEADMQAAAEAALVRGANGNVLQGGDTVTVKVGTKVRNIRLVDGDHDIDCKIDGIG